MGNLAFNQSSDAWGMASAYDSLRLTFSGLPSKSKAAAQQLSERADKTLIYALWAVFGIGLLAAGFSVWQDLRQSNYLFLLEQSNWNKIFWLSMLGNFYLWAKLKHRQLAADSFNLLEFDESFNQRGPLDVYTLFSKNAKIAWNGGGDGGAVELFLSLLKDSGVQTLFFRLGLRPEDIKTFLGNYAKITGGAQSYDGLKRVPFIAFAEAVKLHNKNIDPLMLLCALAVDLPDDHVVRAIFINVGIDTQALEIIASWVFNLTLLNEQLQLFHKLSKFKSDSEINKGLTSVPTYYLDHFSKDLTAAAKYGRLPLALGRQDDLHEIFSLLTGSNSQNLLIKGAEGTGRTTLINELAYKMVTEQVPKIWQDKRLVQLEISAILGSRDKGENALVEALNEAVRAGNIVVVIEDIHQLAKASGSEGLNFLEILINYLQQHPLMVIATTTLENYTDYLKPAANFDQTFLGYELSQLSASGILLACCIRASLLEQQNNCLFRFQTIQQAVTMSDLYVKGPGQPQKAISLLVEAATKAKNSSGASKIVTPEDIAKLVSDLTHIPTQTLKEEEADKLLHLEESLRKYIVGQSEAVTAVCEGLRRARSGLASKTRPLASFMFLGPTGVGKTELAKTVASVYFGEEKYLLRLDMSEYRGPDGLTKLLGERNDTADTPLVKHIKSYPFCLLLVDEFEKASSEILNLFLQILEDGRLTTGRGETLDLTHCMVIATSNAGTREIEDGLTSGKTLDQIRTSLFNTTLLAIYPPELLNRFDGVILFSPLSQEEIQQVSLLQLQYLTAQLLEKGIKLSFSGSVIRDISKNAYDPLLGARPIRRYIQDHVESFVAKLLLSKTLSRGSQATLDLENGAYILK